MRVLLVFITLINLSKDNSSICSGSMIVISLCLKYDCYPWIILDNYSLLQSSIGGNYSPYAFWLLVVRF